MATSSNFEDLFKAFQKIVRPVNSTIDINEVLNIVVQNATKFLYAKGALLRILNKETNQFEVRAGYGMGEQYLSKGPVTTEKMLPDPNELHNIIFITDIWKAPRVEYPQKAWDEGVRMILDVPLVFEEYLLGLLRIYLEEQRDFSDDEQYIVMMVADQCASIIERVQFIENQKNQLDHLATHMDKMSSLGRMAAGIAHEINNPLTGILLYSSNLSKKVQKGSRLEEGLNVILSETQRCKTIIQGLLDFSRDKLPEKVEANINRILGKALKIVNNELHLRHVQIEKHLDEDIPNTFLDENQVEQVFVNLLLNAVHAVRDGGLIQIKTGVDFNRQNISIEFVDDGCGMDNDQIKRIFDPFFTTKKEGTGLGLAVSYGIIKNHEGDIRVYSKQGKGTRFAIKLPIMDISSKGKNNVCQT